MARKIKLIDLEGEGIYVCRVFFAASTPYCFSPAEQQNLRCCASAFCMGYVFILVYHSFNNTEQIGREFHSFRWLMDWSLELQPV